MIGLWRRILGGVQIEQGEGGKVGLLLAHSLANGLFESFFLAAATAQFLSQFEARVLPLTYVAAGGVGYLVLSFFAFLRRRVGFTLLLLGDLIFIFLLVGGLRLGFLVSDAKWLTFALFVAIGPLSSLLELEFWGLAGRLFDLQQGKRLFGLIGSGESLASILGFVLVPILLQFLSDPLTLLAFAAGGILLSAALLLLARGLFREELGGEERVEADAVENGPVSRRYFVLLALATAAMILCHYYVDFAFLSQTKTLFPTPAQIGSFMGVFFGVIRTAEFFAKLFFARWLVRQFGLIAGLALLPLALLPAAGLSSIAGTALGSATATFFLLVALTKFVMIVGRRSIFDPSSKVLYQPLPKSERFATETRVGIARQLAMGVAGLSLYLLTLLPIFSVVQILFLVTLIAFGWVLVSRRELAEYRVRLLEMLRSLPKEAAAPSPLEVVRRRLWDAPASEVGYSFNVLRQIDPRFAELLSVELLAADSADVREEALHQIADLRVQSAEEAVQRLERDREPRVAAAAATAGQALLELEAVDASRLSVTALATSADPAKRQLAARIASVDRGEGLGEVLSDLLWDSDPAVRDAALRASGTRGSAEFWPRLVDQLASGQFRKAARAALVEIGDPVLETLEIAFQRHESEPLLLRRILQTIEGIGGPEAERALLHAISHPSRDVHQQALFSLSRMGYRAEGSETGRVKQRIERAIDDLSWRSACLADIVEHPGAEELTQAIRNETDDGRRELFHLLALICDPQAVRLLQEHISSAIAEDRAYALEIAEQVLPEDLKDMIVPALELSPPIQTVERLSSSFPQQRLSPEERLGNIMIQSYARVNDWTRGCAIETLGPLLEDSIPDELMANLFSADPMVREIAAKWIQKVDGEEYARRLARLPAEAARTLRRVLPRTTDLGEEEPPPLLIFEKVRILKALEVVAAIPEGVVSQLAAKAPERQLAAGATLFEEGDEGSSMYVVLRGRIRIQSGDQVFTEIESLGVLGEIAALERVPRSATAIASEDSSLLEVDRADLYDLIAEHMWIMPAMVQVIAERRARDEAREENR